MATNSHKERPNYYSIKDQIEDGRSALSDDKKKALHPVDRKTISDIKSIKSESVAQSHKSPFMKKLGVNLNEFRFLDDDKRKEIIKFCSDNGEYRCFWCGRIIFKGELGDHTHIQVKCSYHRCKKLNVISRVE